MVLLRLHMLLCTEVTALMLSCYYRCVPAPSVILKNCVSASKSSPSGTSFSSSSVLFASVQNSNLKSESRCYGAFELFLFDEVFFEPSSPNVF